MQTEEMRLDGNAAGGSLRDLFARDVTDAIATCAACGAKGPVATLLEYGQGMGVILRCPHCNSAVIRMVRTPAALSADFSGISFLVVRESFSK